MSETQKKIESVVASIEKIKSKENKIYFFVQDTKGNPKGSVAYMYELCKMLKDSGYNACILHDDEYKGVQGWMGETYSKLPHKSVKKDFFVAAQDMIIVPEILGYVMPQLKNIPCIKIVLCQAYDWIFETLDAGEAWTEFGFDKCITVSDELHEHINSFFPAVKVDTVNPFVAAEFTPSAKPAKPLIAIHSREQRDALNIIKAFYTKYPNFRWFGFRDLRGMSRSQFAGALNECCLSVWVDDTASFGTFPLESMTCGIPVVGKVPAMVPEWMTDDNGIWVSQTTAIIDSIATYLQHWMEDNVPQELYTAMSQTVTKYSADTTKAQIVKIVDFYVEKRFDALNNALTKLKDLELQEADEKVHSNPTH